MTNTTRREDVDDDFDLGTQFVILLGNGGQNCTAICQHLLTSTHAQPTCHPQYGEVSSSDDGHFITQQTCPTTKLGSLVTTPTTTPTMTMTMNGLNSSLCCAAVTNWCLSTCFRNYWWKDKTHAIYDCSIIYLIIIWTEWGIEDDNNNDDEHNKGCTKQ